MSQTSISLSLVRTSGTLPWYIPAARDFDARCPQPQISFGAAPPAPFPRPPAYRRNRTAPFEDASRYCRYLDTCRVQAFIRAHLSTSSELITAIRGGLPGQPCVRV